MAIRDMDRVFPEAPDMFTDAIFRGFEKGRRREKMRKAAACAVSAAAVMVIAAAGIWGGLRLNSNEDLVTAPAENGAVISGVTRVFTSLDDEYFHSGNDCSGGVEMSVEAARGFGKVPCPECLEGVKE